MRPDGRQPRHDRGLQRSGHCCDQVGIQSARIEAAVENLAQRAKDDGSLGPDDDLADYFGLIFTHWRLPTKQPYPESSVETTRSDYRLWSPRQYRAELRVAGAQWRLGPDGDRRIRAPPCGALIELDAASDAMERAAQYTARLRGVVFD